MDVFHRKPQNSKTKILYVGGATWKIKSMLDVDVPEDSFCDLLLKQDIEVFSFDLPRTDHNDVVSLIKNLVREHSIDYIMGYSYGCIGAIECSFDTPLKGIVLLDPFSGVQLPGIETEEQFEYTVSEIKTLVDEITKINPVLKQAYLDALSDHDKFSAPKYPKKLVADRKFLTLSAWTNLRDVKCPVFVAFTDSGRIPVKEHFFRFKQKTYAGSSHWILLEDGRYDLAKDVVKFINGDL